MHIIDIFPAVAIALSVYSLVVNRAPRWRRGLATRPMRALAFLALAPAAMAAVWLAYFLSSGSYAPPAVTARVQHGVHAVHPARQVPPPKLRPPAQAPNFF